jgi:very-short-patch-repair endonuclease
MDYVTDGEIEETLLEAAYRWGDVEEELDLAFQADLAEGFATSDVQLRVAVDAAYRVEAMYVLTHWGHPATLVVLFFDVHDAEAREAAAIVRQSHLSDRVRQTVCPWGCGYAEVRVTSTAVPITGMICRRRGEQHPPFVVPPLAEIPVRAFESSVPLVERDGHRLTPIEEPFYDALRETDLTFSVQPWIHHGTDRRYRVDFLVFSEGRSVVVELDGHDFHQTPKQRTADQQRARWLEAHGIRVIRFTGSEVTQDVQRCVRELLEVLRGAR